MSLSESRTSRSMRLACLMVALPVCLSTARGESVEPGMSAKLELLRRTYPCIDTTSPRRSPGLLLYPRYVDLQGLVYWYGSKEFIAGVREAVESADDDPKAFAAVLHLYVFRTQDGRRQFVPELPGKVKAILPDPAAITDTYYQCRFVAPVQLGKLWTEGHYWLRLGCMYKEKGALKTIGAGDFPFEIKRLVKGSDDEINLLTNAWINSVPGLGEKLLQRREYVPRQIVGRVLELDPYDAWAKHMLARRALQFDGQPEAAVALYQEILADFRVAKAKRVHALLEPYRQLRPRPIPATASEWEEVILRMVRIAQGGVQMSNEAKTEVNRVFQAGGVPALLSLFDSGVKENLWEMDVWQAIWAIRLAGEQRIKEAHAPLVRELRKLPLVPGMLQIQIVDALAQIHGIPKAMDRDVLLPEQCMELLKWWRARPVASDVTR